MIKKKKEEEEARMLLGQLDIVIDCCKKRND